jgi:archaellum component FlaC
MIEWIKVLLPIIVILGVFLYNSSMSRREINARFDGIDNGLDRMDVRLDKIEAQSRTDHQKIEDKIERLNQNYIEHLVHHNKKGLNND